MAHGGARPGAGRKPGSKNKREMNWNGAPVADPGALPSVDTVSADPITGMTAQELANVSPLGFLVRVYRNRLLAPAVRADAAKAALAYVHARPAAPKSDQPELPGVEAAKDADPWGDDLPPMNMRN